MNLNVSNNDFLNLKTSGIETFARDTSTMNVNITDGGTVGNGNIFDPQGGTGRAIGLNAEDTAHLNFNINRNATIYGNGGPVINVFVYQYRGDPGRINNNGTSGVEAPADRLADLHPSRGRFDGVVEIAGNTITRSATIRPSSRPPRRRPRPEHRQRLAGRTIKNNAISVAGSGQAGNGVVGIDTRAGSNNGDTTVTVIDVNGNNVNLGPAAVDNIAYLAREGSSTAHLYLEGFTTNVNTTWNNRSNTPLDSTFVFNAAGVPPIAAVPAGHNGGHVILPSNPNA